VNDVNSFNYRMPVNSAMQLDETGTRFCVRGTGGCGAMLAAPSAGCPELERINSIAADTTRTAMGPQFCARRRSALPAVSS